MKKQYLVAAVVTLAACIATQVSMAMSATLSVINYTNCMVTMHAGGSSDYNGPISATLLGVPPGGSRNIVAHLSAESGMAGSQQFTLTVTAAKGKQLALADVTTQSWQKAGSTKWIPQWKYNAYDSKAFAVSDPAGIAGKSGNWMGRTYTLVVNPGTDTKTYKEYCGGN